MRIVAGEFRGRKLQLPRQGVRPTADRVKEALFSILGDRVRGAVVLDLFAGSGNLGLEALSRGAESVDFVEIARAPEKALRDNVELLGVADRISVVRADAVRFAAALDKRRYDIAFADPPYGEGLGEKVRDIYLAQRFSGIFCIEHRAGEVTGGADVRRYGDTELSFFEDE